MFDFMNKEKEHFVVFQTQNTPIQFVTVNVCVFFLFGTFE